MSTNDLDKLVLDALYYRRTIPDTCLQTNLAARELEQSDANALSVIENALATLVTPTLHQVQEHRTPGPVDLRYEEDQFPGLSGLLGAYMVIGSKYDAVRLVHFLRSMPVALQAKAAALVPAYFRKELFRPQEKDTNNTKTIPDKTLLSYIRELSQAEDESLRKSGKWAMAYY